MDSTTNSRPENRRKRRLITFAVVAGLIALLFVPGIGPSESSEAKDRPRVLTTFTVIADMVREVGGDRVDVRSITKPGAEIHGYEPTPGDLRRAASADLVIENGMNLERWFEQFIDNAGVPKATITKGITPIPIAGESEYAGKPNPHAWMSVSNAETYVANIAAALTELDPEGTDEYARNADRYAAEIASIGRRVARELDSLPGNRRALVTCEGAFSYLARDLGLTESYLWPVNAEQEGTPQQIGDVVKFVRSRNVPAVFCESTVSDKAQRQVATEAGADFGGDLYVDSLSQSDGPVPTYLRLLEKNAATILRGLTSDRSSK